MRFIVQQTLCIRRKEGLYKRILNFCFERRVEVFVDIFCGYIPGTVMAEVIVLIYIQSILL